MSLIKIPVGGNVAAVLPVLLVEYYVHQSKQVSLALKSYASVKKHFSAPILTLQDGSELKGGDVLPHLIGMHNGSEAAATVSMFLPQT